MRGNSDMRIEGFLQIVHEKVGHYCRSEGLIWYKISIHTSHSTSKAIILEFVLIVGNTINQATEMYLQALLQASYSVGACGT